MKDNANLSKSTLCSTKGVLAAEVSRVIVNVIDDKPQILMTNRIDE